MATPATARRSEPTNSSTLQNELEPLLSPLPHRETTPRPSISPLSAKASPVAVRDVATLEASTDAATDPRDHATMTANATDDRDDRSSSLSDPIDDEEVDEHRRGSHYELGQDQAPVSTQFLEVDSEAETERLDQTPRKSQQAAGNAARTPSRLNQAAAADEELSDRPSPPRIGPDAASSISAIGNAGKKRKRSDTADSSLSSAASDLVESPRKRSHSSAADDTNTGNSAAPVKAIENATVDPNDAVNDDLEQPAATLDAAKATGAKGAKGKRGGKMKGKWKDNTRKELETEPVDTTEQPAEELSEEAAAKSAEETKHKHAASTAFEDLAKQFSAYREKMNNEKLAAVNAELEMLGRPVCKHPEYLRQMACVDARREKQVREATALRRFKRESLVRTVLGERSQLHSQYFQWARECREEVMYKLGEDWYNIQTERRQHSEEEDERHLYRYDSKKSVQIKRQAKYNQEVSVLSGFAKYVGFPAAPEISGAERASLEDDLKSMKITKRAPQTTGQPPPPVYFPNRTGLIQGQSERLAHEQFIEQNAWARPQLPIQHHGTPNLTHTPDWAAEPGPQAKHLSRTVSANYSRTGSPFATPMQQRRADLEQHSSSGTVVMNSDQVEAPSSVMAAPTTTDRAQHGHSGRDQGSPLAVAKHRQTGGERELTGFRNISNISGASTIDAPLDSAERGRETAREALAGVSRAPATDGALRGHGAERRKPSEMFAHSAFRAPAGAFGTPTPLVTTNHAQS